jgi:GNAT superfamily N-acetyltransferase
MDPNYRRLGIGTALTNKAISFSLEASYQTLYLHTHPFLPGAIPFWKAQGFVERLAEADPVWKTLHMDKKL